jgi:hypothetical protein
MDVPSNLPVNTIGVGTRRNEDIALDLMKFVAAHTDIAKGGGVGFQTGASAKEKQDQADKLLELYSRCLTAVQGARK